MYFVQFAFRSAASLRAILEAKCVEVLVKVELYMGAVPVGARLLRCYSDPPIHT